MRAACVRCSAPARAVLSYAYTTREVWLVDLAAATVDGVAYPLCETHAARLVPPVGWVLHDRRDPNPPLFMDVA